MSDVNTKSWMRLRALVSKLTLATLATAGPAAAATTAAPASDAAPTPDRGRQLAIALARLPTIESMGAAAELALSTELVHRQQLADALAWSFPLPGDQAVIEHLAQDPSPAIRAAAARAAWVRRSRDLDRTVLYRLFGDADPEVRAAAWLAVSR
ncbi:MAG: hypothetical protein R3B06_00355 [Kofleriaceae bacterium]